MNSSSSTLVALAFVLPLAAGCASRTAPFNEMDQAQITVLKLTGQPPAPAMPAPVAQAQPTQLIPGLPIPPEMQQAGQQLLQGVQQAVPGLIPPGLIPGQQPTTGPMPTQPPPETWEGIVVLAKMPLSDENIKNDLLDLLGDEDSFQDQKGSCFTPGFGISMVRPNNPAPVDVLVSFSCNQVQGAGFTWPYKKNGLTADAFSKLSKIYGQLWSSPVPPGG